MKLPPQNNCCIAVIGLGYVGFLAIEFAKNTHCKTNNFLNRKNNRFDIDSEKIKELSYKIDRTNEIDKGDLNYLDTYLLYL